MASLKMKVNSMGMKNNFAHTYLDMQDSYLLRLTTDALLQVLCIEPKLILLKLAYKYLIMILYHI